MPKPLNWKGQSRSLPNGQKSAELTGAVDRQCPLSVVGNSMSAAGGTGG